MSVIVDLDTLTKDQIRTIQTMLTMIPVDPKAEEYKRRPFGPRIPPKTAVPVYMFEISPDEKTIKLPFRFACSLLGKVMNHDRPHVKYVTDGNPKFGVELREEQKAIMQEAYTQMMTYSSTTLGIPPGFGKCLGLDTKLLSAYGGYILAKDVKVGDYLIGDDSTARRVLSTCRGTDNMYKIVPKRGRPFICNEPHVLTLKGIMPYIKFEEKRASPYIVRYSMGGHGRSKSFKKVEDAEEFMKTLPEDIFDMPLNIYVQQNLQFRSKTFLFHAPVNFTEQPIPFDPYMIGYWLGDGASAGAHITTNDPEIVEYFKEHLAPYGAQIAQCSHHPMQYSISGSEERHGKYPGNALLNTLKDLNLINNKHIPLVYMMNSREVRLRLLAGIVDSDGCNNGNTLEILQKPDRMADDIEYLCFSLGLMVTRQKITRTCAFNGVVGVYNLMHIYGESLVEIPTILPRKQFTERISNHRVTCNKFSIEPLGPGEYAGFTLDGNGRFLLDDFTVTHNTICGALLSYLGGYVTLVYCNRDTIMRQWYKTFAKCFPGYESWIWMVGVTDPPPAPAVPPFIICMDERSDRIPEHIRNAVGMLIIDEAHMFCTPTQVSCLLKVQPRFVVIETATLERDDGMHTMMQAIGGFHGVFRISSSPYTFVRMTTHVSVELVKNRFGTNYDMLCKSLAAHEYRNMIIVDIIRSNPLHKFIVLTRLKEHVELLERVCAANGITAAMLYGTKSRYEDSPVLIGTMPKMGTGFDEENACDNFQGRKSNVLILAHSVKKWQQYEQFRGRVMRCKAPIVIWLQDENSTTKKHFDGLKAWITETNGTIINSRYIPGSLALPPPLETT